MFKTIHFFSVYNHKLTLPLSKYHQIHVVVNCQIKLLQNRKFVNVKLHNAYIQSNL